MKVILKENIPASILSGFAGSVSDNTPDVMKEGRLTFDAIMNYVEEENAREVRENGRSDIFSKYSYSDQRLVITLRDVFI